MALLYPDRYVYDIYNIPLEDLRAEGRRALLFDLDNTITLWNSPELSPETSAWFARLPAAGFAACLLSNNQAGRIQEIAARLAVDFVCRAHKPLPGGYRRAMAQLGATAAETVMVGDQLFTDILGGNWAGLHTILVEPLGPVEYWGTKINRRLEALVRGRLRRRLLEGRKS
jgi:HAD superfamily phosphatase (TIGR01668 family)